MEPEDSLLVMEQNKELYPEYDALPFDQKEYWAYLNGNTGTAETFLDDDGKVAGVGGIRYIGIGEAWLLTLPEIRQNALWFYRRAKSHYMAMRDSKHLWRIFAETRISETFLKHLGFNRQNGMHVWTKVD